MRNKYSKYAALALSGIAPVLVAWSLSTKFIFFSILICISIYPIIGILVSQFLKTRLSLLIYLIPIYIFSIIALSVNYASFKIYAFFWVAISTLSYLGILVFRQKKTSSYLFSFVLIFTLICILILNLLKNLKTEPAIFNKNFAISNYQLLTIDSIKINPIIFDRKKVYIDFWFSKCKPCIDLIPNFLNLADEKRLDTTMLFVSICNGRFDSFSDFKRAFNTYYKNKSNNFMLLYDENGILNEYLNIYEYPAQFLLTPEKEILHYQYLKINK